MAKKLRPLGRRGYPKKLSFVSFWLADGTELRWPVLEPKLRKEKKVIER